MSFTIPAGPNKNKSIRYNLGRNSSADSFDLNLDDSLDQVLDNLQISSENRNTSYGQTATNSINNERENFELKSVEDVSKFGRLGKNSSKSEPLLMERNYSEFSTRTEETWSNIIPKSKSMFERISSLLRKSMNEVTSEMQNKSNRIKINKDNVERIIKPDQTQSLKNVYPSNEISNAKYNPITFVPILLYEQFKFFYNLYFLVVALSQAVPALRIGYLSSYIVPLAFVLTVTMLKEAIDDIQRRRRDRESNGELYEILQSKDMIQSKDLKVGDLIKLNKGERVPADAILLQTSDNSGEEFIKTDQLDGETDWKLRIAPQISQTMTEEELFTKLTLSATPPEKSIHSFLGKISSEDGTSVALSIDNTLWANTVVASNGSCIACVIYTGKHTRQSMNTTSKSVKTGLLEIEINSISKLLCISVFALSVILVVFAGKDNKDWYIDILRYLILFSTIIPVSLRVNLDLAKSVYAYQIEHDQMIPETIVRTSTIPEDLGRIEYLLSDKTGTLTQNDMQLRKIHLGSLSYSMESMDIVSGYVDNYFNTNTNNLSAARKDAATNVCDLLITLALCHNVTPSFVDNELTYQAASPDEIAIVKFTEEVGLSLFKRDRHSITLLHRQTGEQLVYEISHIFPFNSVSKRMGIIVFDKKQKSYWFLQKGADTVMSKIVQKNSWLEEEVDNMAREGLRTLVIGRKKLPTKVYEQFIAEYNEASVAMTDREIKVSQVISKFLEYDVELLGLTGVEDILQKDVKSSIELLRNAGIKIWMLTGDKVETAKCVSISAKLISRGQYVHTITKVNKTYDALNHLEFIKINKNACLIIDGESLAVYLKDYKKEFLEAVLQLPTVVACRCSPQQKADVALLIREFTGKRVCCIGDGGNDVSMIQSADVGVGIVGKEGKQASLAADFSITQFCHLTELLLWHGRNSYKRSAKLSQFIMHRGLVIAICQVVFSICSGFEPIALYQGWLMVGYATCYTMAPVFSLTLDTDIPETLTKLYPELYQDLIEGKSLSHKTFFVWVVLSIFQGCIIQLFSQFFTGVSESLFTKMVAISFTSLVLNELVMVALEIYTWNKVMVVTELVTLSIYVISVPFLSEYFDLSYFKTLNFFAELLLILSISVFPVWASKAIYRKLHPPSYAKVQQYSIV
ncbi:hypothetical protein TPHA_0C01120 [Tetrapisispora phaffii CBS 4417]|uniref:Phospholipid-transporting ATPase n=1 Tax=Tetrapisispora phaffii (strain ATCC 24235 / CBS 4417 / NBRC 1672 / NRRL Y-8282 / UCD 70-5) TaxID=1071381 RepID=G8BR92_TETPH|nr:hypothetical protein TPHA_0C01120 [Tetrapisispora phaffii CBS 4417]CCE62268.1 hypothetical protein TPHA_0C01120 [Tetrapisispora phaffii CBS 4417]